MKYIPLCILCFLFSLNTSVAQTTLFETYKEDAHRTFFGGPVFGLNATQIDGDGYGGYDKTGIYAGIGLTFFINQQWGVDFQMLYSRKGSIDRGVMDSPYSGTQFSDYYAKVNVVEIPVNIAYYHFPRWAFLGGPVLNLLISEEEVFHSFYQPDDDFNPNFEKWSLDLAVGIRYNLFSNFFAQAKFSYSVTPMRRVENTPLEVNYGRHQSNNQLSFGFQYIF